MAVYAVVANSHLRYLLVFVSVIHIILIHGDRKALAIDQNNTETCPGPETLDNINNAHALIRHAEGCGYDRWVRPGTEKEPLQVHARIYVYFLGSIEAHYLQFTAHILIRLRWRDTRLEYRKTSPEVESIVGEGLLRNKIWVPHVYLVNEHESKMMGADQQDILVTALPDGTIFLSTRMKVTLFCLMNLQKFPFDQQECPMVLESWTYNTSELILQWEPKDPVVVNEHLHLTEYSLIKTWPNESVVSYHNSDDVGNHPGSRKHYGKFAGNYSSLMVRFQLAREVGHYIMDYYVPSILLVVVSWVSFWLDPNAVPGRTTLGTSTMLTFITLTRNTGSSLPKVSYIKATEVWFIVCTAFIFGSLVEFAFVNTIWRRKQNVELKKVNSKYILKSTLTPQLHRKQLNNYMERCQSWPSVTENEKGKDNVFYHNSRNELSVHSIDSVNTGAFRSHPSVETVDAASAGPYDSDCQNVIIPIPTPSPPNRRHHAQQKPQQRHQYHTKGLTTMTPQEIANWIDRRSRLLFPASFILFNILYWGFVWI